MGDGACSWRLEVAEEAQMLLTLSQWLRMPLQPRLLLGNTHRAVCTQTRPVRHIKQGWQVCWSAASLMATPPENSSLRLCECVKCSKHFPITVWVEVTQKCLDHRAEGKRQAGTGETGKIGLYGHSSASLNKYFLRLFLIYIPKTAFLIWLLANYLRISIETNSFKVFEGCSPPQNENVCLHVVPNLVCETQNKILWRMLVPTQFQRPFSFFIFLTMKS